MLDTDHTIPKPEFLELPETTLVTLSREVNVHTRDWIGELWGDIKTTQLAFARDERYLYGATTSTVTTGSTTFSAGFIAKTLPPFLPPDWSLVTLSAGHYAVFRKRGDLQDIPNLYEAVFTWWLPQSRTTRRAGLVFERYPCAHCDPMNAGMFEIWVPVDE